jgi:CPA2 family monovalent cation:H+ antiporter-2
MITSALGQLLVLLATVLLVVAGFRRLQLPPILGYLAVGMALGPQALNLAGSESTSHVLSEFGVVFLVFTLGLEFSLPRMLAMRWEVLGLGGAQMVVTSAIFAFAAWQVGVDGLHAVVIGGALAMSSTAIVVRQLNDQLEMNRTHSRLAIGILLFQDLAFAPLLALENALTGGGGDTFDLVSILTAVARSAVALLIVLAAGRWLAKPLFHEIGRIRSTELFTLAVLLVALGSAWVTSSVGLSMALGAFLAGLLLAESEFRHQVEVVIRPFRDILLGLFFVTVGTQLDLHTLFNDLWIVLFIVLSLLVTKTLVVMVAASRMAGSVHKALR